MLNSPGPIQVTIDPGSGFCFGVTTAINKAEEELARGGKLYCLGDIVHNNEEVNRLHAMGMDTITHSQLDELSDVRVLLRAHGEPPETYATARRNNIEIIDATCPVVLQLQRRVKECYDRSSGSNVQIVIYGKRGHAEVNGLVGQTDGNAIVIEHTDEIDCLDFTKDTALFSQTTKSIEGLKAMSDAISRRLVPPARLTCHDTICRQVANRVERLKEFARSHDLVLFVSGSKSSNGRILYNECLRVNTNTHMVSSEKDLNPEWLDGVSSVGVCGATSTPRWLMERVKDSVINLVDK
ncbi:MAG: 4-hydroxy-3-methylbut-2-enyl diphosphate reductase [Muribaculaceae bacterium]|nr:4-hydroxy-3-methylbut-2-enyl diphosphate reductase [Muribaculaceae bacterium]